MSDKLLTKKELEFYKDKLMEERQKSLDYIQKVSDTQKYSVKDSSGDDSAYAIHQADHGSDTYHRENQVLLLEKENEKIKTLNVALNRVYEGTFGICEICGKRINPKRIEIIPYAAFCIECRSAEDVRNKSKFKNQKKK